MAYVWSTLLCGEPLTRNMAKMQSWKEKTNEDVLKMEDEYVYIIPTIKKS